MHGDVNAIEVYQNRRLQTLLGFGIYDIAVGSTGDVGFEDVHKYTYIADNEKDPKFYRRRVYDLTGQYYPNDLARALWHEFNYFQAVMREETGKEPELAECVRIWLAEYGHAFFKNWALSQPAVPSRIRDRREVELGRLEMAAHRALPQWRDLINAGFSVWAIVGASLIENLTGGRDGYYLRLVARLSGLPVKDKTELLRRETEIEQLRLYLSQQIGQDEGGKAATIEYYRRLKLVAEIEQKPVVTEKELVQAC